MKLKRILSAAAASVVVAANALPAFAEDAAAADEVTVYGSAGISFQYRDTWEHRNAMGQEIFVDTGDIPCDADFTDVNITGNGSYEVTLTGWWGEYDDNFVGWVGLDTTFTVAKDGDVFKYVDYPDMVIKLDSYSEGGVDYDLSEVETGVEDNGQGEGKGLIKIINGWNTPLIDYTNRECMVKKSDQPVSIKFTVSGLPTDKVEGYADEIINFTSGNGAAAADDSSVEDSSSEEDSSSVEDSSSAADSSSVEESSSAEDTASAADSGSSSEAEEESNSMLPFILIGVAAVVLVVIIVILIVRK